MMSLYRAMQLSYARHHELIKFAIVGATTFVIDSASFYCLKMTILSPKPVTAKVIAGIIAVIASYILNREWSFKHRGGRERHHEAFLFFAISGIGVIVSMLPLWCSIYILHLRVPHVSLMVENIADFIAAYIIGNLLQMILRFWAFRRWVFPDEISHSHLGDTLLDAALPESVLVESLEDLAEQSSPENLPFSHQISPRPPSH